MKVKKITSAALGEWMAMFQQNSTEEEYQSKLHAMRCIFDVENDPEFWDEVCEAANHAL